MPDDHSKVVPLLPIPNRKVKRLSADDSADSRVKVGHRQASIIEKPSTDWLGVFFRPPKCIDFLGIVLNLDRKFPVDQNLNEQ